VTSFFQVSYKVSQTWKKLNMHEKEMRKPTSSKEKRMLREGED
jgi:hypothetical protein